MKSNNTTRGFLVSGNILLAGVFFLVVGVFGFNFFEDEDSVASISIEPQKDSFVVNENIVVDVFITSRIPFNALSAELTFPNDHLEVISINNGNPIIDLWVIEPNFSNEDGLVTFAGGSTRAGGVVGKGSILNITFKPLKVGGIDLVLDNSLILKHDGVGTDLAGDEIDADFIVNEIKNPEESNVIKREIITSYTVKESSAPTPDLNNDGKYTVSDLSAFMPKLTDDYNNRYDFNEDGKVNIKDVSIIMSKVLGN